MDFLSNVAETACQHQFHLRMHVFHAFFNHKFAVCRLVIDFFQFGEERRELIFFQQTDAFEHRDVCHRAKHVVRCEIKIHLAVESYSICFNIVVYHH